MPQNLECLSQTGTILVPCPRFKRRLALVSVSWKHFNRLRSVGMWVGSLMYISLPGTCIVLSELTSQLAGSPPPSFLRVKKQQAKSLIGQRLEVSVSNIPQLCLPLFTVLRSVCGFSWLSLGIRLDGPDHTVDLRHLLRLSPPFVYRNLGLLIQAVFCLPWDFSSVEKALGKCV